MSKRSLRLAESLGERIRQHLEKDSLSYSYLRRLWLEGNDTFSFELDLSQLGLSRLDFEQRLTEDDMKVMEAWRIKE